MQDFLAAFLKNALQLDFEPDITVSDVKDFGNYSTNVAMKLAKAQKKNPLEIANTFQAQISAADIRQAKNEKKPKVFAKIAVMEPGFINFFISKEHLHEQFRLLQINNFSSCAKQDINKGNIIIEFSSPNIAKPMHVGHLRSTVIGDALANIYTFLGYKVYRWNYIGDWGTQFGKLITAYKRWGSESSLKEKGVMHLLELYIRFHEEAKTNSELEKTAQEEFRKLELNEVQNTRTWKNFRAASLEEFNRVYKELGIKFDIVKGESDYSKQLEMVVSELKDRGLAVESQGTMLVQLDDVKLPPALIQKSDGASLYLTRDIATLKDRLTNYKAKKVLYVVGNEQTLHFSQLFAVIKKLGIQADVEHIKYGLILGEDGKKFSTREGNNIALSNLLKGLETRAYRAVKKNGEKFSDMREGERRLAAHRVAIAALKFNDLKENRLSDVGFDWDKMLDLHGDSGPYLQYTCLRLKSIISKASFLDKIGNTDYSLLDSDLELELVKKTLDFSSVVNICAETNLTSHLAKYLIDLSHVSNQYYECTPILKDKNRARKKARLKMVEGVSRTLEQGLGLLGIQVPERI